MKSLFFVMGEILLRNLVSLTLFPQSRLVLFKYKLFKRQHYEIICCKVILNHDYDVLYVCFYIRLVSQTMLLNTFNIITLLLGTQGEAKQASGRRLSSTVI